MNSASNWLCAECAPEHVAWGGSCEPCTRVDGGMLGAMLLLALLLVAFLKQSGSSAAAAALTPRSSGDSSGGGSTGGSGELTVLCISCRSARCRWRP